LNPGKDLQLSSVATGVNAIAESPDVSHIFPMKNWANALGRSGFQTNG